MEEETLAKIDQIMQTLELIEKKNESYKQAVLHNLDALETELERAAQRLEVEGPQDPAALSAHLSERLLEIKPLTQIEQSNKKFYKYISKLGKRIELLRHFSDNYLYLYNAEFDQKALKEAIAQYIFYYAVNNVQEIESEIDFRDVCEDLGVLESDDMVHKLQQVKLIKKIEIEIDNKSIDTLKQWVENNLNQLTEDKSTLPFLTFRIFIIQSVMNKSLGFPEALKLIRSLLVSINVESGKQINRFLTSFCFWNRFDESPVDSEKHKQGGKNGHSQTSENNGSNHKNGSHHEPLIKDDNHQQNNQQEIRINQPNLDDKQNNLHEFESTTRNVFANVFASEYTTDFEKIEWQELKTLFVEEAHKILRIPKADPLFEVFRAGVITYPQFLQFSDMLNSELGREDNVGLSVDLGNEFNYHSLVVCPVSKEVCTKENPPVVLNCGHVISDASAKKLAQIRGDINISRKFKCPVCPEEQLYSKIRVLKVD